jgi:hypothetical protein
LEAIKGGGALSFKTHHTLKPPSLSTLVTCNPQDSGARLVLLFSEFKSCLGSLSNLSLWYGFVFDLLGYIYNSEYLHGYYAILVVCHVMLSASLSYAIHMLRLEIHAKATVWCALWACSSSLLVHPQGGRPGGLEQVPYTRAWCSDIMGSIEYNHIPRCCRGRRQVVIAMSVRHIQAWFVHSPTFGYGVGV